MNNIDNLGKIMNEVREIAANAKVVIVSGECAGTPQLSKDFLFLGNKEDKLVTPSMPDIDRTAMFTRHKKRPNRPLINGIGWLVSAKKRKKVLKSLHKLKMAKKGQQREVVKAFIRNFKGTSTPFKLLKI